MTDTLKLRMGELDLGDLAILDAGDIEGLADNPISHPLNVDNRGAAPRLLYRDLRGLNRENGRDSNSAVYELNLGAILAATAVVFTTPLIAYPTTVSMLLLLSNETQAGKVDENLRLVLIDPARDGNVERAALAGNEQYEAVHHAADNEALALVPVNETAVDFNALIRHAMQHQAVLDVGLPVPEQELSNLHLKLLDDMAFDKDGVFYFRDAMTGEADFLFDRQDEFDEVQIELNLQGGEFYMLDEGEELVDLPNREVLSTFEVGSSLTINSRDVDLEGTFSRLVILADGSADKALLSVEIQVGQQVVMEEVFQITLKPILPELSEETDTPVALDTGSGLPEDELLEDVGDIDGAGFSDPAIEIL